MQVSEVEAYVRDVLGTCDETEFYKKLNLVIEMLADLGIWDPLVGSMDVCAYLCTITLPDDVEVPLLLDLNGRPRSFRSRWFEFHINGPGADNYSLNCSAIPIDNGPFPTIRDLGALSRLAATSPVNEGPTTALRVFGFDADEKWIMSPDENGVLSDGFDVLIAQEGGLVIPTTQYFKRITRVRKPATRNFITLYAVDDSNAVLGDYRPYELEPQYRRMKFMGQGCTNTSPCNGQPFTPPTSQTQWVRLKYRRKTYKVSSLTDFIPLHSTLAIQWGCKALKKLESDLNAEYQDCLDKAKMALIRRQNARNGKPLISMQVQKGFCGGGAVNQP